MSVGTADRERISVRAARFLGKEKGSTDISQNETGLEILSARKLHAGSSDRFDAGLFLFGKGGSRKTA
ncbi:MAG: hypothetical protein IJC54_03220 [Clostridia bacterium]|nr:hypothetical protein [Clostridia bacterium]